ncbi:MAG: histidinol dehydrogenase [Gemmatimonadota bacterium]
MTRERGNMGAWERGFALPIGTRVDALTGAQLEKLFDRARMQDPQIKWIVSELIENVRHDGDTALREQAFLFDRVNDLCIEVPRREWFAALDRVPPRLACALEEAAGNIERFHRAQLPSLLEIEVQPGLVLGRRADPLERVGVYAPGGRASYPSSVLMGVVPARAAGVNEVIVCSPADPSGRPADAVLAACAIGKADRLFALGGAGAIAALAYGTGTVPRVDKIVGPGNAYVTEAKRQLSGVVAVDCPAGPSEVLVVADASADAELVAWELLAQAEHDPQAACVLVTTAAGLLTAVAQIIERELETLARASIVGAALSANGALLLAADTDELLEFANRYAPEHLVLYLAEADAVLARTRNAGTIFLGSSAAVAFGDYLTGANHVLPTGGLARAASGLSVLDFLRWTTYQRIDAAAAAGLAGTTALLADAEGLSAHARAARLREAVRV